MKKPGHKLTTHHLLPKASNWTSNNINKQRIREVKHRAIHTLYWPASPVEQIILNLSDNEQVLQEEFMQRVLEVLEYDNPEYIYKDWVYKPRKYTKWN